jgi:nondiscriminating glutamyl-tRNA synthetase
MDVSPVRVRIAPSPTGNLHVGTARTALFNYLFAQHAKHTGHGEATFILRIEDTDLDRSEAQYVDDIYEGLRLLGLQWDEGPDIGGPYAPYVQSERGEFYQRYAERLLEKGLAYYCYKTQAELDAEKERAVAEKRPYLYERVQWTAAELDAFKLDPNRKPSIRFRVPENRGSILLDDLVRGEVPFDASLIGDFVLMKSNGTPAYNFACVVDDITMVISHVIRGEDHISNTPKQILIYEALAAKLPAFAHVSMILAPDRSKLSKRYGATAVAEFIRQGYLPEAFANFMTLLGWSSPEGTEIASLETFARQFTLDRIAHSPAVFDQEKLNWLNGMYIRQMPLAELRAHAERYLRSVDLSRYDIPMVEFILDSVREPLTTLSQLPEAVSYFGSAPLDRSHPDCVAVFAETETASILKAFEETVFPTLNWESPETLGLAIKAFANSLKPLKMKTVMWAIRAAVSGRVHGADLSRILFILGPELVKERLLG